MTDRQIIVRIDAEGQIHAETVGMKGQSCLDSLALLEDLLEAEAISSAFTREYYDISGHTTNEDHDELRQQ